ncbi:hypothetical protein HF638_20435 [Paenibacillus sp. SZ31]|uniref:hypothetical protein n=1 Tax=Paenibacillus sp. SZ31 TaxID=2725555 RepID=UPI00146E2BCE|nr:hypothetical protein [Paenibacillus sp. SZ31]NMI06352.1 hypothetical protein [Paenibacillus sp. SZ31]
MKTIKIAEDGSASLCLNPEVPRLLQHIQQPHGQDAMIHTSFQGTPKVPYEYVFLSQIGA